MDDDNPQRGNYPRKHPSGLFKCGQPRPWSETCFADGLPIYDDEPRHRKDAKVYHVRCCPETEDYGHVAPRKEVETTA